jgi:hypothetical protein
MLNDTAQTFLLGSDQVWRYEYARGCGHLYFLDFVVPEKKRIAFGSSFGIEVDRAPDPYRLTSSILLDSFDAISVREKEGVAILKDRYDLDSTWVLDPVFLCDSSHYTEAAKRSQRDTSRPFVLSYILDPTEAKRNLLCHVRDYLQKPLVNMLDAQVDFEAKKKKLNLEGSVDDLTVEDWLAYMEKCEFLVTDSFHGMCFALIFHKPFVCIGNAKRGLARFKSILGALGLTERLVEESVSFEELESLLCPIKYEPVDAILAPLVRESKAWLSEALKSSRSAEKTQIVANAKLLDAMGQILLDLHVPFPALHQQLRQHLTDPGTLPNFLDELQELRSKVKKLPLYRLLATLTFGQKRQHYRQIIDSIQQALSSLRRGE